MKTNGKTICEGVVRGRTIELREAVDLPDGQEVKVTVDPIHRAAKPGDGIARSAGAWSDAGAEIDVWLEGLRRDRDADRSEPGA